MKKIVIPKFSKISLTIAVILFCVYIFIRNLAKLNTYIYLFGVGTQEIMPFMTIPCVILCISSIAVFLYKNIGHKALITSLTIVILFLICSSMLLGYALSPGSKYFEYTSDDGEHHIVVKECSFLLGGWGYIYEKNTFGTMKKVGSYYTDDGFLPFSNDAFYFVWNENDFELHHSVFGTERSENYQVVKMEYVK